MSIIDWGIRSEQRLECLGLGDKFEYDGFELIHGGIKIVVDDSCVEVTGRRAERHFGLSRC